MMMRYKAVLEATALQTLREEFAPIPSLAVQAKRRTPANVSLGKGSAWQLRGNSAGGQTLLQPSREIVRAEH